MSGINRHTGHAVAGHAHLAQSILGVLTTPKGTMPMLRDYGSDLPDIIDQPINGDTMVDLFQAVAESLDLWEPRIDLARIALIGAGPGYAEIELTDQNGDTIPLYVDASAGHVQ